MNNATANNPSYEFYPPKNINGESNGLEFQALFVSADWDDKVSTASRFLAHSWRRRSTPTCSLSSYNYPTALFSLLPTKGL
jgi:hypothetical protein